MERNIPLRRVQSRERGAVHAAGVVIVLLLPIICLACLLTLPVEWLRARRLRELNEGAALLLAALRGSRAGGTAHQAAAADAANNMPELGVERARAQVRDAARLAALDYRIDIGGRLAFAGAALVALPPEGELEEEQALVCLTAYRRSPPPEALDAEAVAEHVRGTTGGSAESIHLEWPWRDAYELTARGACPW